MKENKDLDTTVRIKNSEDDIPETDIVKTDLSIVSIGSSAGGLDALLTFLDNVPELSGLSFVIVQHMEKKNKSVLVDLLQSATTMKVVQAYENISVEPNCVYVILPDKNLSINNNVLHLSDYVGPDNLRLPIDFFFC